VFAKLLGKIGFEYLSGAMFSTTVRTKGKSVDHSSESLARFPNKIHVF